MPAGATWDEAWDHMLEFRYRSSERFEKAAHSLTSNRSTPRATVDYNYHGNPPFSFEVGQRPVQHAGNADFVTGETGVWGFSALGVGLNAEFYRAATPGRPFQIAIQRGVRMYHDQTTRPLNDIRWELFTLSVARRVRDHGRQDGLRWLARPGGVRTFRRSLRRGERETRPFRPRADVRLGYR